MENTIIDILHTGQYSCVIKNRTEIRTFTQRGVADLYDLYQSDPAFMKGASIADKVIGKGAAALMVLGGMRTVYADIISTPALTLLCHEGIESVTEMYPVIQNFIKNIRSKKNQPF